MLAGLVLKIFLAVLPSILAFMGRLQGLESKSSVDFSVNTKYYTFQAPRSTSPACEAHADAMRRGYEAHPSIVSWFRPHNEDAALNAIAWDHLLPWKVAYAVSIVKTCISSSEALAFVDSQFITVFLGSFVAGSVLNQAKELINHPTSIISTLGTSAPLTSVFFLTFIELNVCLPAIHPHTTYFPAF